MTEKIIDYTASAVKLCNPYPVESLLKTFHSEQDRLTELQKQADTLIPTDLKEQIIKTQESIATLSQTLRKTVDELGSYQDLGRGWYAVKQRKLSKSYLADPFERTYPQFAMAVIVRTIDTTKLNGLIKGGLLEEARLEADGVLKITESYAYIIR